MLTPKQRRRQSTNTGRTSNWPLPSLSKNTKRLSVPNGSTHPPYLAHVATARSPTLAATIKPPTTPTATAPATGAAPHPAVPLPLAPRKQPVRRAPAAAPHPGPSSSRNARPSSKRLAHHHRPHPQLSRHHNLATTRKIVAPSSKNARPCRHPTTATPAR